MALWLFDVQSHRVPCFHEGPVPFSIMVTSLEEERAGLYPYRAFVCFSCTCHFSSWCWGLAAGCNCKLPGIFIFGRIVKVII